MSYASNSDILTKIGPVKYVQLTNEAGGDTPDESRATQARESAEAEIDSYLARRYLVPVVTDPAGELGRVLQAMTVDLAAHRLYERKPPVPEDIRRRHDWVLEWLHAVASGTIVLADAAPRSMPAAAEPIAVAVGKPRVLTPEEIWGL